jgi:hypothetical protein
MRREQVGQLSLTDVLKQMRGAARIHPARCRYHNGREAA